MIFKSGADLDVRVRGRFDPTFQIKFPALLPDWVKKLVTCT